MCVCVCSMLDFMGLTCNFVGVDIFLIPEVVFLVILISAVGILEWPHL